jgi:predicted nuclease of predicted toxin-antitoxin system
MRFLIDARLPLRLVAYLRAKGHEAEHVATVLGEWAKDAAIVAHAKTTGAVIVSKDADFMDLLADASDPQLLWVRSGNSTNRLLILLLDRHWPRIEMALRGGQSVVEVG